MRNIDVYIYEIGGKKSGAIEEKKWGKKSERSVRDIARCEEPSV